MSHLLIAAALRPSASAFRQCVAKAPIGRRALFGRIPDNCARFVGRPQRVGPGIRTMSKKVEEVESASFFRRVWQSINDRVNRIPKVYRVGFRVARVGFLAFTLYNLGKAEGMAEYATNPEAYCQHILVSVISQFTAPGVQPQDVVITGPTEDRVIRILQKVVDGATKTLTRLHDQSTDPDEQERYREAFKMLKRRWNVIVLDCDAMNAFVHPLLPGHIFFLTGLVGPEADFTDEEIAMVCAHELSHALLQHGREALASQGMVVGLKMAVLTALDPSGILSLVVELLLGPATTVGLELPFSRSHETEADHMGAQILADSCFDLVKASGFFDKLASMPESDGAVWTSTHPHPAHRAKKLLDLSQDPALLALNAECEEVKDTLAKAGFWNIFKQTE